MTDHAADSTEDRLRDWARDLGLAAIGFAPAAPAQGQAAFLAWLDAGCAAGMDYLRRQAPLRDDPRRLQPEARTVICVAAHYPAPPAPGAGFASYARNRDYHDVLGDKLRALAARLRSEYPRLKSRVAVDSAPLPEREWAVRAGLGWLGRQGQLIHPQHGACLVLGELLVDIALAPSPAVPNQCGDCRCCLTACPTGALGADGHVDARRCLAYLTIEHDGPIPAEFHGALGTALFGCDRCTAVCPWNTVEPGVVLPEFQPQPMPSAADLLAMDEAAFAQRFRGTPIARSGLARLQRNARIVQVNGG